MLLKSDGSPDFSGRGKGQLSIQVDPSLRSQSGGPILTSFNFSRNEIVPGLLHQDSNGLWIWDLELTSVVLKVPPIPGGLGSRVFYSEIGYVTNDINWPPPHQVGGFGGNQLLIPEEGGDIEFQVPAGQYIFHVGRNVSFGGVDGVYLQPSGVTILEPDSDS